MPSNRLPPPLSLTIEQKVALSKQNVVHYIDFEIVNYSTELNSICDASNGSDSQCLRSFKICLTPLIASHKTSPPSSPHSSNSASPLHSIVKTTTPILNERSSRARFTYFGSNSANGDTINPFYDESKKLHRRVNTGTFASSFNGPFVGQVQQTFVSSSSSKSKSSSSSSPSTLPVLVPSLRGQTSVASHHMKQSSLRSNSPVHRSPVSTFTNTVASSVITSPSTVAVSVSSTTAIPPATVINETESKQQGYLKSFFNKILGTIKAAQSLSSYVIPSTSTVNSSNDTFDFNNSALNQYGNQCSLAHWITTVSNGTQSNQSAPSSPSSNIASTTPVIVLRTKVPTALLTSLSYLNSNNGKRHSVPHLPSVITRSRSRFSSHTIDRVKVLINIELWQENNQRPHDDHHSPSLYLPVNKSIGGKQQSKVLLGTVHDELNVSLSPETFTTDGWIQGEYKFTHSNGTSSTSNSTAGEYVHLYSSIANVTDTQPVRADKLIALKYRWKITEEIVYGKDSASKGADHSLFAPLSAGVPGEIANDADNSIDSLSHAASTAATAAVETTTKTVCPDGYTGLECKDAICTPGCHVTHGYCDKANECKCKFGWTGQLPITRTHTLSLSFASHLTLHLITACNMLTLLIAFTSIARANTRTHSHCCATDC